MQELRATKGVRHIPTVLVAQNSEGLRVSLTGSGDLVTS